MSDESDGVIGQIFHAGHSTKGWYFMCAECQNAQILVSPATHKKLPVCECGSHDWVWVMKYDSDS